MDALKILLVSFGNSITETAVLMGLLLTSLQVLHLASALCICQLWATIFRHQGVIFKSRVIHINLCSIHHVCDFFYKHPKVCDANNIVEVESFRIEL